MIDTELVKKIAADELEKEQFAEAVKVEKSRLRDKQSFWDRVFPWVVTIRRK